jgi:hypothetical protein
MYKKQISDQDLIKDLIKVSKKLRKNKVSISEYTKDGKYNSSTLYRRFGSWFKALEKAGLEKTINRNITIEDLFKNIEIIWKEKGSRPFYRDIQNKEISLCYAQVYVHRFGSWKKALNAFMDYKKMPQDARKLK